MDREQIERTLDASQEAVEAALVAIYERQTAEEKAGRYSRMTNGVGFSKFDADFCSSLVQQIKRGRRLTPAQLAPARRKMKRYWRQLLTVMNTEPPKAHNECAPQPAPAPVISNEVEAPMHNDYGTW